MQFPEERLDRYHGKLNILAKLNSNFLVDEPEFISFVELRAFYKEEMSQVSDSMSNAMMEIANRNKLKKDV